VRTTQSGCWGRSQKKLRSVCDNGVETVIIIDFGRAKPPAGYSFALGIIKACPEGVSV